MQWFSLWWNGLRATEQILYCIAIPASLVLIIQTVMVFIGMGNGGEGINPSDTSGLDLPDLPNGADMGSGGETLSQDVSNPVDISDFRLLSVQSVMAFLTVFSWSGISAVGGGMVEWAALLLAAALGFCAMLLVAKVIQFSSKLAQNGTFDVKNLLGECATVYIPIPEKGKGKGKINLTCGERFVEYDAVSESPDILKTGTSVRIVDVISGNTLVVEKSEKI